MNISKTATTKTISLVVLCSALILSFSATAFAEDPTLQDIKASVANAENAIQDIKIEYTCVRSPLGEDSAAKKLEHPGHYKPETGVYIKKGSKERLERSPYYARSTTERFEQTISCDGSVTRCLLDARGRKRALLGGGRWHGLRKWFNPVLTFSANGDKKLSEELSTMDAQLVAGLHDVSGTSCRLVKLYKNTGGETPLRSFNVYLDPARNYALVKVEKYWYDFQCLERTVEIQEFTKIGNTYIPAKAKCVTYNRPHKSQTTIAVCEQELTVNSIKLNEGIEDSTFVLTFPYGTKIWDNTLRMSYEIW